MASLVEVRPVLTGSGRPRILFRGSLEENGVLLTEDAISDTITSDGKFWAWVDAQTRANRLPAGKGTETVSLKLSLSFLGHDGSVAVLDAVTGATSAITDEPWEFYKTHHASDPGSQMQIIQQLTNMVIEQQKQLPIQMEQIFKALLESGQRAITTSASESAKIIQSSIEPLKSSLGLIEKAYQHESMRADKASDCVIRMLNDRTETPSSIDEATKLVGFVAGLAGLLDKTRKMVN